MKLVQQAVQLKVDNHDESSHNNKFKRHGALFPNLIRCLISGPSGGGKTNLLLTLLCNENGLRFKNVYLCSKTIDQAKYKVLDEILNPLQDINLFTCGEATSFVTPEDIEENSIVIFDDVNSCAEQELIKQFFTRGRHKVVDMFFLIQSYASAKKQNLRDNCNFIILFKQDKLNLKHVFDNHVIGDMKFEKFIEICNECWKEKFGFLVIDKESIPENGRYRCGMDRYISIN